MQAEPSEHLVDDTEEIPDVDLELPLFARVLECTADLKYRAKSVESAQTTPFTASRTTSRLLLRQAHAEVLKGRPGMYGAVLTARELVWRLGQRISIYPHIAEYAKVEFPKNPGLKVSLLTHLHSLRHQEIYVIMENAVAAVDLLQSIETDCGISSQMSSKRLEKTFKSSFEYRLRDRHRATHVHEPATISGHSFMRLNFARELGSREAMQDAVTSTLADIARIKMALDGGSAADAMEDIKKLADREAWEAGFATEAGEMWAIVERELNLAFASNAVAA
jgi:hypothetical protein